MSATTRKPARAALLRASGADRVFVDTGTIVAREVREVYPQGVDKVLELVGTTTLEDSLHCAKRGGAVCMIGMVGNAWSFEHFAPMDVIPSTVNLTSYSGTSEDFLRTPLNDLLAQVEAETLKIGIAATFGLDEIVAAHRLMESDEAGGKIVVLT